MVTSETEKFRLTGRDRENKERNREKVTDREEKREKRRKMGTKTG